MNLYAMITTASGGRMSLRRVVAFFLLLAVSVSSVEVVIGGEARFLDAAAAQTVGDTADSPESPGDTED